MKRLIAVILLILLPLSAFAADYPARVAGISDCDTLTVLKADKTQVKVRLHGIDAPETGQDFGSRAKQAASELAFGKDVTIREVDHDRYGRTVAKVILPDGMNLNREMVEIGMAWYYRQFAPGDVILNRAEVAHVRFISVFGASRIRSRPGIGGRVRAYPSRLRWSEIARATCTIQDTAGRTRS